MKPAQVLDMQADLLSRLQDWRFSKVMRTQYATDLGALTEVNRPDDPEKVEVRQNSEFLVEAMGNHVRAAYAYRVTEDMSALVQHAATGLDATDKMVTELAPTGCGLVRFDRPLPMKDVRGNQLKAHWCLWGPISVIRDGKRGTYTAVEWFNDRTDPDDTAVAEREEYTDDIMQMLGRWRWIGGDVLATGYDVGEEMFTPDDHHAAIIAAQGDTPTPGTNARRYIHALWLLLGQTIVSTSEPPLDRATVRRTVRRGLEPRVTVIALRRTEGGARTEGESQIEWKHRWLVRNYWRWQHKGPQAADHPHLYNDPEVVDDHLIAYCAVGGCTNRLERIMVHGHWKGPEDAPVKWSEKVYSLEQ